MHKVETDFLFGFRMYLSVRINFNLNSEHIIKVLELKLGIGLELMLTYQCLNYEFFLGVYR